MTGDRESIGMTEAELKYWARSCLGKIRHPSQVHAGKAAKRLGRKRRVRLVSYYCHYCAGYHLTKQTGAR